MRQRRTFYNFRSSCGSYQICHRFVKQLSYPQEDAELSTAYPQLVYSLLIAQDALSDANTEQSRFFYRVVTACSSAAWVVTEGVV